MNQSKVSSSQIQPMGCQIAVSVVEIREEATTRVLKTFKIRDLLEEVKLAEMMRKSKK